MRLIKYLIVVLILQCEVSITVAQQIHTIDDHVPHYIFTYGQIECLRDQNNTLTFREVLNADANGKFEPNRIATPKTVNAHSTYWYKIKIRSLPQSKESWILEFFDQTIDHIDFYAPGPGGKYKHYKFGAGYQFSDREYLHKNFIYDLDNSEPGVKTYYMRIRSAQVASVIIVLRHMRWFVQYSIKEYILFGLFYGMILVFGLYNLLMFFAVRQIQYLYYVLYNLSIGLYEMCIDGIAFQYLWPDYPDWNRYAYGPFLYLTSIFGLLFTLNFLYLRTKAPKFYWGIIMLIALRTVFFLCCLYNPVWFSYKVVEVLPIATALAAGIYVWKNGYRPGRFFVVGYSFLLLGFLVKLLVLINVPWLPYGPLTHYSLSICFVIEMVLVSFAMGDNIRTLRKKKENVQKRIISQLRINERLKDTINEELSILVDQRTKEVNDKAAIIAQQNAEISLMNAMLEKDNQELHQNIEKVTRARVMSHEVDFGEFSKIYPDRETCFKYLADLKWVDGYTCRKCNNSYYLSGSLPFSRRCTKCGYDESVIAYTIFQNSRIPINKAFYMLFLVYSSKGKISSYKLSELLLIRQSTCWAYNSKMQKMLTERKSALKNAGESGWNQLILEN